MNITPEKFLESLKLGETEKKLNRKESDYIDSDELRKLTSARYGHTVESAKDHLLTDYSNGFTICKSCGSFYELGNGFTKHLSNGCLHCEGSDKHRCYYVNASKPNEGNFPARWMCVMFDDGMSYCKDNLKVEKYKGLVLELSK